ncbi:MAG: polymer-forming cytoskeletal protein [Pseudomonadota bacterium]
MWGNKKNRHHGRINTIIGQATKIYGDIDFSGGLHIDGHIIGNIISTKDDNASMTISEHGLVEGEIHIPNIIVNGTVEGNIYSSNHLELVKKARIHGNVYYNIIEIAVGAEINGNLEHGEIAIEEYDDQQALFLDKAAEDLKLQADQSTEQTGADNIEQAAKSVPDPTIEKN